MKSIAVFCGSSAGIGTSYSDNAFALGQLLAQKGIRLVYGGAKVGLMGAVADGALSTGGQVIGVIPDFLRNKEIAHPDLSELIITSSMHERKMRMFELSDGVIALPGGFGTMDEVFEMLTWAQLGLHQMPIALLNMNGYYDHFEAQVKTMIEQGFLKEVYREMLLIGEEPEGLLENMADYQAPEVGKWIRKEEV